MSNTDKLYDLIEDLDTAMLVTENSGEIRSRPMKGKLYRDDGQIWFLSEKGSSKLIEMAQDRSCNLTYACPEKQTFVSVSGIGVERRDMGKIDDLWGPWAEAWMQCQKDDPKVTAICFTPTTAEYWDSPSSAIRQTWELAKAHITDEQPDHGDHAKVDIA